eukprot:TRINITY_DN4303_c0_g1::TRINITY_DN4303_c0_g1_i1::g.7908::m.7908 TRINITY_DN4303_c0_g1::TRINITY_DN4303_c0_g1_i1::g.7908  ORF type:complete len:112 (+),score=11.30,sp/Q8RV04/TI141_ARATH/48.65/2e-26,DnaJ/PF00226.26/1.4e-05,Pam16/PF03656.8/6.4e-05,Reductase_C/PF14759.1/0.048 TRINITY_DN4303_c0_g1_i1:80-415(+)
MATPLLVGAGVAGAAWLARIGFETIKRASANPGFRSARKSLEGFESVMTKREAAQILGLKEYGNTSDKIKEAHKRIMLLNHPDRGGSIFIAAKINEAKDMMLNKKMNARSE